MRLLPKQLWTVFARLEYLLNQDAAIAEEDNHFKDLQDEIDVLRTVQPDLIPEDINASSLVDVDAEVSAVQPPSTDAEILADFLETDHISDDELVDDSDDVEDVPMECPGKNELLHALELFQKFSLFVADGLKCKNYHLSCLILLYTV